MLISTGLKLFQKLPHISGPEIIMPSKSRPVTAKSLQALLTRIGSPSSGTKDVLQERFKRDLTRPRLFALRPDWQARQKKGLGRKLRILSIDMGIKNLAYCDTEVDYANGNAMNPTMDIIRWDKLNLVDATRDLRRDLPNPRHDTADADEEVDPYSLSVLSQTAYWFVRKQILEVSPDIILIERQRWRSASSAAIQQWTVRVNTLEAMLWAVLETLRMERDAVSQKLKDEEVRKRDYIVYGVDPKRVGQFWLGQHARARAEEQDEAVLALAMDEVGDDTSKRATAKKIPRSKAEKKAKIALLRSWLSTKPASTASSTPDSAPVISFTVGQGAVTAREALCLPTPTKTRKKKAKAGENDANAAGKDDVTEKDMKKLDDITDCCLQAAAWVAWESNRLQLYDVWDTKKSDDGNMPELDDATLKEMVEVAGEG
jgi:cruciform cutting endonuclease 1